MNKLSEKDLKSKIKFHEKKAEHYTEKLYNIVKDKKKIGFRY